MEGAVQWAYPRTAVNVVEDLLGLARQRQRAIAPEGVSVSSAASVGIFGFQAG
jgi:hypothetical protein